MTKSVGVHIVTYNSEEHIEGCLESVFRQVWPIAEVIVVDNASSDRTNSILEQYAERIRIIRNDCNTGFAPAHNQAIAMSGCDYCLVLNPDIQLDSGYVERLVAACEAYPGIGSATGKLLRTGEASLMDSAGLKITKARRAFDLGTGEPEKRWQEPCEVFGVSGAAALYSMAMIKDISVDGEFFDEDFFAYKEDVDVAWRARLLGWKAYYEPLAVAYHERGWKAGERSERPLFIRRKSYINRYKMMLKNDRMPFLLRDLVPIIVFEVLGFGYVVLREPGLLGAWLELWRQLPKLLRKRRLIVSKQRVKNEDLYRWFEK